MSIRSLPQEIAQQARTWLGTPFHHQARVKGKGCDCLGLIIGVAKELGLKDKHGKLIASHDEITYPKQPSGSYLTAKLSSILEEVPIDKAEPGHLALFNIAGNPQHLAILTDYNGSGGSEGSGGSGTLGLIHCDERSKRVVECRLDQHWQCKLYKAYKWQY